MRIGGFHTYPHYQVIGDSTAYYIWIQLEKKIEGGWAWYEPGTLGASDWIKGREAFKQYNKLKEFFDKKQYDKFIDLATHLHRTNKGKTEYDTRTN